ncbi:UNVERIFIED_CONTAM: hypothetical protein GTU68_026814 [Idotea baltica]|nr:hypothetical protein [Idotea baltica]
MEFSDLLKPEAIKVNLSPSSKKRLMHDVADLAAFSYGIDAGMAVEALLERESLGPTGVGHGVALPHARIPGLIKCSGVFLVLGQANYFDSVDRPACDLVFGLFCARRTLASQHLSVGSGCHVFAQ